MQFFYCFAIHEIHNFLGSDCFQLVVAHGCKVLLESIQYFFEEIKVRKFILKNRNKRKIKFSAHVLLTPEGGWRTLARHLNHLERPLDVGLPQVKWIFRCQNCKLNFSGALPPYSTLLDSTFALHLTESSTAPLLG